MTVSLDDVMKKSTPEERAHAAARTAELVREELALRDLRQAQHPAEQGLAYITGDAPLNSSRRGRAPEEEQ